MIALDDMTEELGGTRVIPGSHLWEDCDRPGSPEQTVATEMRAGSGMIYSGKVIHGGGANRTTDRWRFAMHISFVVGWLTPEEASALVLSARVDQDAAAAHAAAARLSLVRSGAAVERSPVVEGFRRGRHRRADMKYLPLLWAGLWRKPIRTVLTMLSIAVAFLLFGVLHGVIAGFDGALAKLSDTRLRVTNRANIFEAMPIAYKSPIAHVPGVRAISYFAIFVGYFQDPKNGFSIAAVDVDSWLDAIPNFEYPPTNAKRCIRRAPVRSLASN